MDVDVDVCQVTVLCPVFERLVSLLVGHQSSVIERFMCGVSAYIYAKYVCTWPAQL